MGSGSPKWRQCSAEAPLRVRHMSLCLPGYYGEMCSSAVPLVPVRGAGVGCVGSRPTCHLGLRDFLGLGHAVFAPFPRGLRGFCLLAVWDAPAKAGPAPPAGADGNCSSTGRGSLQLIVVRNLTACSTRSRTGTAVKRWGRPGQLHTDRPCSLEPVPALTRAPSRAVPTLPPRLGVRC